MDILKKFSLEGRTALVTGGAYGIGFAVAEGLAGALKSFTEEFPIRVVASTKRIVHSPHLHSFGSVIYEAARDRFYEEDPYERIEVTDRIGSGDAYVAGVLYGLLSDSEKVQEALYFGNAASAVKNTIPGDLPVFDRKEIEEIIQDHHSAGPGAEMKR